MITMYNVEKSINTFNDLFYALGYRIEHRDYFFELYYLKETIFISYDYCNDLDPIETKLLSVFSYFFSKILLHSQKDFHYFK